MKKILFVICVVGLLGMVLACGMKGNSKDFKDVENTEDVETLKNVGNAKDTVNQETQETLSGEEEISDVSSSTLDIEKKLAFLKQFYDDFFLKGDIDWDKLTTEYKKHCSKQIIKTVQDSYDYDCESGDCYAWWIFRDGSNDFGPEGYKVDYSHLDGDWFNVRLKNFDVTNVKVKVEEIDGVMMITGLKNPEYNVSIGN